MQLFDTNPDSTFYFGLRKLAPGHKMVFTNFRRKKTDLSRKKLRDILVFTKGTYLQKRSIII